MNEPHTIWYHGTTAENAERIRKEGFRAGTYFGADLADAVEFGGDHIFEVPFPSSWKSEAGWQMTADKPVPPEAIVAHYLFIKEVIYENETLRERVFQSNEPKRKEKTT